MTNRSSSGFINNRTKAVRLPTGTQRVRIRAQGLERMISPGGHCWDSFFADMLLASDDAMGTRASQAQADRETL